MQTDSLTLTVLSPLRKCAKKENWTQEKGKEEMQPAAEYPREPAVTAHKDTEKSCCAYMKVTVGLGVARPTNYV